MKSQMASKILARKLVYSKILTVNRKRRNKNLSLVVIVTDSNYTQTLKKLTKLLPVNGILPALWQYIERIPP